MIDAFKGNCDCINLTFDSVDAVLRLAKKDLSDIDSHSKLIVETSGYKLFLYRRSNSMSVDELLNDIRQLFQKNWAYVFILKDWIPVLEDPSQVDEIVGLLKENKQKIIYDASKKAYEWLTMMHYLPIDLHILVDGHINWYGKGNQFVCDITKLLGKKHKLVIEEVIFQLSLIIIKLELNKYFDSQLLSYVEHVPSIFDLYKLRFLTKLITLGLPKYLHLKHYQQLILNSDPMFSHNDNAFKKHQELVEFLIYISQLNQYESLLEFEHKQAIHTPLLELGTHMCWSIEEKAGIEKFKQLTKNPLEFYDYYIKDSLPWNYRSKISHYLNEIEPERELKNRKDYQIHLVKPDKNKKKSQFVSPKYDHTAHFCIAVADTGVYAQIPTNFPSGTAHACEHLLARKISISNPDLIFFKALTTPWHTLYYGSVKADSIEKTVVDIVRELCSFEDSDKNTLNNIIEDIHNELLSINQNPFYALGEELCAMIFKDNISIRGTIEDLDKLTTDILTEFIKKYYLPYNLTIGVSTPDSGLGYNIRENNRIQYTNANSLSFPEPELLVSGKHIHRYYSNHPVACYTIGILFTKNKILSSDHLYIFKMVMIKRINDIVDGDLYKSVKLIPTILDVGRYLLLMLYCQGSSNHINQMIDKILLSIPVMTYGLEIFRSDVNESDKNDRKMNSDNYSYGQLTELIESVQEKTIKNIIERTIPPEEHDIDQNKSIELEISCPTDCIYAVGFGSKTLKTE